MPDNTWGAGRDQDLFAFRCVDPSPINIFLISSAKKSACLEHVLPLPCVISCPAAQELHISKLGVLWERGTSPEGISLWPGWADVGSFVPTALISLPGVRSEWQVGDSGAGAGKTPWNHQDVEEFVSPSAGRESP